MSNNIPFVFFGTSPFAVTVLDELALAGFVPTLIVTQENKPKGRHLILTPPPVKVWAESHSIEVIQPQSLKDTVVSSELSDKRYGLFIVASYGKIIPQTILDIPSHQTLNVHPSLLPKLRGPAPVQTAILEENETGVTIMRLDAKMDEGPIVAQKKIALDKWPPYADQLEDLLAHEGGKLLASTLSPWISGDIKETPQDHSLATYSKKIQKEDGRVDLNDNPEKNLRKIRAYTAWPRAHTTIHHDGKEFPLIVKKARLENGTLVLERVIPPGRKEMSFEEFEHGFLHKKTSPLL